MFLSSSFCDVVSLFSDFAGEEVKGKRVTFIPTASVVEEYVGHVENDKKAFESLGIIVDVLELSTASNEEIIEKVTTNNYIFMSGGNSFYLLQTLKEMGADYLIKVEVSKGKLYIGTSAGSVVMCPDIRYIEAMDDKSFAPKLTEYKAMGMIDQYPLVHYGCEPFTEVAEQVYQEYKDKLPLVLLNNYQVLTVQNQEIEVLSL
ncbi:Type 1 glutamine amidotransferase-like domain-containing protein [Myroides odoratimimus]|uniref:Type 1 glutamine amidotransferase-like domain-containing protein n=1 Tax=Myroides odoratimimus TaxID=76832 RepID=UPI0009247C1F|nr:Type 1 glutamine amidotransferase-like domain-containing protein [Myroides odoratimimus]SHL91044.1 dipeptidase E [Myroides odoratimimus subsp. xuanwuensis]